MITNRYKQVYIDIEDGTWWVTDETTDSSLRGLYVNVTTPRRVWTIKHWRKTNKIFFQVLEGDNAEVTPQSIKFLDENTVEIVFEKEVSGKLHMVYDKGTFYNVLPSITPTNTPTPTPTVGGATLTPTPTVTQTPGGTPPSTPCPSPTPLTPIGMTYSWDMGEPLGNIYYNSSDIVIEYDYTVRSNDFVKNYATYVQDAENSIDASTHLSGGFGQAGRDLQPYGLVHDPLADYSIEFWIRPTKAKISNTYSIVESPAPLLTEGGYFNNTKRPVVSYDMHSKNIILYGQYDKVTAWKTDGSMLYGSTYQSIVYDQWTHSFITIKSVPGTLLNVGLVDCGCDYSVLDVLTFDEGDGGATIIVTSVDDNGGIVTAQIFNGPYEYTIIPSNPNVVTTSGGGGYGAKFAMYFPRDVKFFIDGVEDTYIKAATYDFDQDFIIDSMNYPGATNTAYGGNALANHIKVYNRTVSPIEVTSKYSDYIIVDDNYTPMVPLDNSIGRSVTWTGESITREWDYNYPSTESHTFKPDGTTFYMVGGLTSDPFGQAIREYKLETPWVIDPELNSYCIDPSNGYWYVTNTLPLGRYTPHQYDNVDEHMHVTAFSFSHDGTKAYAINEFHRDTLMQFTLQTPYEFMALTYDGFIGIEESSASEDITFNDTGTIIYLTNSTDNKIIKISLGIAWDISSETGREVINLSVVQPVSTSFKSDGTKVYFYSKATDTVYQYTCATPWDIATATDDSVSQLISEVSIPATFRISSDGTRALAVSSSDGACYSYDLSVAWDLTTLAYDAVTLLNTLSTSLTPFIGENFDIFTISSDGTKIFRGIDNTTLIGFDLPGAWNISSETMFPEPTIRLAEANTAFAPMDMQFSPTGSDIIVVSSYREWTSGIYKNKIYSWTLSTPWDLSSATYDGYKYVNYGGDRFISGPECVFATPDGITVFIGGDQTYGLQKFTLSTPWDVTSAGSPTTYTSVGKPYALYFTADGLTMITADGTSITKRTLTSAYDIASATWESTMPLVIADSITSYNTINSITIANSGTTLFAFHGITLSKFTVSPALEFNTTPLQAFSHVMGSTSRNGEYVVSFGNFHDPAQTTVKTLVYDLPAVYKKGVGGWTLHGYGDPTYSNTIQGGYIDSVDVTDDGNLVFVTEGYQGYTTYIFELIGNIYTFLYEIPHDSSSVQDGCSISSDGSVMIQTFYSINTNLENNLLSGVGVYRRNGAVWDLDDILYPEYGGAYVISTANSNTGFNFATISGDGTRVMLSGVAYPLGPADIYAPQVFKYSGGVWTYENSLPLGQLSNLIPSSIFNHAYVLGEPGGRLGTYALSVNYKGAETTFMSTDGSVIGLTYTAVYHPLDDDIYQDSYDQQISGVLMYRENQGGEWNLTNVLRNPISTNIGSPPRAESNIYFNIGGNSTGDRIVLRNRDYEDGNKNIFVFDYNVVSDKYEFVKLIYDPTLEPTESSITKLELNADGTELTLFADAYSGTQPKYGGFNNAARGGGGPFKYTLPAIGTLSKVTYNNPTFANWDTEADFPYVDKIDHRCPYVGFNKGAVGYEAAQWGTQTIMHGTTGIDANEYNSMTAFSSGKKYVEFEYRCSTNEVARVGVRNLGTTGTLGNDVDSYACVLGGSYPVTYNNSVATDFLAKSPILNKDIFGIAVDFDTGNLWFSVNGQWISDGDPSTGTSPDYVIGDLTALKTFSLTSMVSSSSALNPTLIPTTVRARTGVSQLTFAVPSGFEPWDNYGPTTLSYDDLSVYDRLLSHYQTPVGRWSFNNQYITGDVISDRAGSNNLTLSSSSSLTYIDSDAGIDGCFVDLQLDTPASNLEFDQEIKFGRNEKWGLLFWQYFYDDDDADYVGTILSSSELGVDNNEFILTKRAFWLSVYASDGTTSSTQEIANPTVTEGYFGLIGLQGNGDGTIKIFTGTSWSDDITLPGNSQFAIKYIGARDDTQNPSNGFTSSMVLYDDIFYQVYTGNKQINDTWYYWTPGSNRRTLIEVPEIRGTHIRSDYDSMTMTTYESYVTPRLLEIVSDYGSLTLTAYSNIVDPGALSSGVPVDGTVAQGGWDHYNIDTVPGTTNITVILSNQTGDVDLYTNFDTPPDSGTYLCRPYSGGTGDETCSTAVVHPRKLCIAANGYQAGSYTITATLS
jgi:hypothetical protein